eukprot:g14490.t1
MAIPLNRSPTTRALAAALAVAVVVPPSSMMASALDLIAANCPDLRSLPTTLTEDTTLLLDVPTVRYGDPTANWIACDEITTVHVDGPYKFIVTSDLPSYNFENTRFEIKGGAELHIILEAQLSFNYAESQGSNGGAIYVESGASATFDVPGGTSFEGNTVEAGYSGGVLYAGGEVEFLHGADFISNEARGSGSGDDVAGGGAVAVGPDGSVVFHGDAEFTNNKAHGGASGGALANFGSVSFLDYVDFFDNTSESGGNGGAVANFGSLFFGRRSSFNLNVATEDDAGEGGYGGAIFAAYGSITEFKRRTIWHDNEAASGGALYNLGEVTLNSNGFIRGNKAVGSVKAEGGHIYYLASVVGGEPIYTGGQIKFYGDKVNLREGEAKRGGALFAGGPGSSLIYFNEPNFIDNSAVRRPVPLATMRRLCNLEGIDQNSGSYVAAFHSLVRPPRP